MTKKHSKASAGTSGSEAGASALQVPKVAAASKHKERCTAPGHVRTPQFYIDHPRLENWRVRKEKFDLVV